jgi:DNA polymerase epsilon subunit 2
MPTTVSSLQPYAPGASADGVTSKVILADKHERYDLTYEGCHVFNPGGFVGNHFEWSVYYPATGRSELR